ncbi:hypothetical protein Syun_004350 [Stephania yunnanensis]|uniref:Glucosamine inositolphosphorylceramide transferase 1 N-terminal domain-containing protein n=1 Tax=Stephania yunnanensis TaxID=152371 RepID=A0AAP0Q144_9MAGN
MLKDKTDYGMYRWSWPARSCHCSICARRSPNRAINGSKELDIVKIMIMMNSDSRPVANSVFTCESNLNVEFPRNVVADPFLYVHAITGDSIVLKFEKARSALEESLRRVEDIVQRAIGCQVDLKQRVPTERTQRWAMPTSESSDG